MKKRLALFLALILVATALAGCGSSGGSAAPAPTQAAGSSAAPAAVPGEKIVLKIGHVEGEERSTHKALLLFKEELEQKSNGRFQVEIYPNAVLGGDAQMTEAVALGSIQGVLPSTSVLASYNSEFGILDMPFLFDNAQAGFQALDNELGQKLTTDFNGEDFSILGYTYNGPRSMTNSKKALNEPADLKGLKVRVMESQVFIKLFETLGANATPMSFSELFTALQQKTVDAQENPPSLIYASRFQEVQKYLSLTQHVHNYLAMVVGTKWYEKLGAEDKALLDECMRTFVETQRAMELEDNGLYIDKLREAGMEVNEITPENNAKFQAALAPMYADYEPIFGNELFELARKYNN